MNLGGAAALDDGHGYWSIGLSSKDFSHFIDPGGHLDLEDVKELAAVPISTRQGRWLLFLDSKEHPNRRFDSDDLQALTIFSRIASATLETVHQNEVRFRYVTLARTIAGLRHAMAKFVKSDQTGPQMLIPLERLLVEWRAYAKSSPAEVTRDVLDHIIRLLAQVLHEGEEMPLKGDCREMAFKLKAMLEEQGSYVPTEDILYEIARLVLSVHDERESCLAMVARESTSEMWGLAGEMIRVVTMLVRQTKATNELDILSKAMDAVAEKDDGIEVATECNANELLDLAVRSLRKNAAKKNVRIECDFFHGPVLVKVRRGEVFLAFLELLQNAIDAAGSANADRCVRVVSRLLHENGPAQITILNGGMAISMEKRRTLAEGGADSKANMGLGLRFVHDWIKSNGGNVQGSPGSGLGSTAVSVMIPLVGPSLVPGTSGERPNE
jgi:signal transduction histidine kinase